MKFKFTDKPSYLAWRQQWRENYARLSAEIRVLKRARKQYIRTYRRYETTHGVARELVSKLPNPEFGETWRLPSLRIEAGMQMELLAEAKVLSFALKKASIAHPSLVA